MGRHLQGAHVLGCQGPQPGGREVDDLLQELSALGEGGAARPVGGGHGDRTGSAAHHLRVGRQRRGCTPVSLLSGAQILRVPEQGSVDDLLITAVTSGDGVVVVHAPDPSRAGPADV